MNTKVNNHFFKLEAKRDLLAKHGKIELLRQTYKNKKNNLKDLNKQAFWNRKISDESEKINKSPIYIDKVRRVVSYLQNKHGKILDVGLGYGDIESKLSNMGFDLYGIDISNTSIKSVRSKHKGVFKVASILKIPFRSEMFDFAIALDILEHLPAYKVLSAYSEIRRVLKPNGCLIVSIPINEHLEKMLATGNNPNGHMRVYTQDLITSELDIGGFKIIKSNQLYAFSKYYWLKNIILKIFLLDLEPNLFIAYAVKK